MAWDPAEPTTWQPLILVICPTSEPTAPAAPETKTVSPDLGWPMSRRPKYAAGPGIPNLRHDLPVCALVIGGPPVAWA